MSKDILDDHTVDALPRKVGRPAVGDNGPMSNADRQRKMNKGKTIVRVTNARMAKIKEIALRKGIKAQEVIDSMIDRAKLPPSC
jgi:hypothetical protein